VEKATQQSQPKGRDKDGEPYEPIEIPVPSDADVMGLLEKAAKPEADDSGITERQAPS
jgi:hypothetical protein